MTAIAVGKFDALHRGHRCLADTAATLGPPMLLRIAGMAEALGWEPRLPLVADQDRPEILADWRCVERTVPFFGIRHLDPAGFIAVLREEFAAQALVIGEDFRGGPQRAFPAEAFATAARQAGMAAVIVPLLTDEGVVSSSRVRALLSEGRVDRAASLLGRHHRVAGIVQRGDGRGRKVGVPTANLAAWQTAVPASGVYAAWAGIAGARVPAVLNIGHQPTIGADRPQVVEAHLIGWAGDAYGQRLTLDLVDRLRPELRFSSLDALVTQLHTDIAQAHQLLLTPESIAR